MHNQLVSHRRSRDDMAMYGSHQNDTVHVPTAMSDPENQQLLSVKKQLRRGVTPQAQTSHLIMQKYRQPSLNPTLGNSKKKDVNSASFSYV